MLRPTRKLADQVWPPNLREQALKGFRDRSLVDVNTKMAYLPVAKFVSMLYDYKVLKRENWPTSRIIEDMHYRGYAQDVFTKPSYGAEPPPMLSEDECLKWMSYYRVIGINETIKR